MTSCIRARCPLLRRELPPSRWTEIPPVLRADSFVRSTVFTDRGGETTGESVHCFAQVAQVQAHELAFVPALSREIAGNAREVALEWLGCALSRVLALATANGDFLPPFAFGPGFVRADVVRIERIVAECLEKLRNRIERGILPLRGLRRRVRGGGPAGFLPKYRRYAVNG